MKLLIATHNPAKKEELKKGFTRYLQGNNGYSLLILDDLHIHKDPEETGTTFFENARLKAHYFGNIAHLPTVSDDGGIEIDALGGKPGVHSKRWLGRDADDAEMINYTLEQLKDIPLQKRTAHFTVCLYYFNPQSGFETSTSESVDGHLALLPSGNAIKGYPYRALFIVDKYNRYYDELTNEEHNDINHRLRAIQKLTPFIKQDLLQ